MPARLVVILSKRLLFGRLAKDSVKENSIVINAVKMARLIVRNDRVSNSIDKPFWI